MRIVGACGLLVEAERGGSVDGGFGGEKKNRQNEVGGESLFGGAVAGAFGERQRRGKRFEKRLDRAKNPVFAPFRAVGDEGRRRADADERKRGKVEIFGVFQAFVRVLTRVLDGFFDFLIFASVFCDGDRAFGVGSRRLASRRGFAFGFFDFLVFV